MSAALMTIAKCVFVAAFLGGLIAADRANMRILRRARESGYRYWLVNPMAAFAGFSARDFMIILIGMVTMGFSFLGIAFLK
jgi:hypothetical protein